MKSLSYYLTLFTFLFLMAGGARAQEQLAIPLSKPGEPGKLEVGVLRGSMQITGYDGKEVIIKYSGNELSLKKEKSVTPEGLRRISSNSVGFDVEEDNNVVEIGGISPMHDISFEISVPRNFSLDLSTVNGDGITVENVNGTLELSNVNGEISLINVGGSAVVNTVNGKIKATFNSVSENEPMAFSNLNGDIDVTLPAEAALTAKMKSEWGEIFTDFDMEINRNDDNRLNQSSNAGTYKVSINNWIYGTINGGGPEYLFKSMRGNIYIRKK